MSDIIELKMDWDGSKIDVNLVIICKENGE
jgi:hypothetical protein